MTAYGIMYLLFPFSCILDYFQLLPLLNNSVMNINCPIYLNISSSCNLRDMIILPQPPHTRKEIFGLTLFVIPNEIKITLSNFKTKQ